MITLDSLLFLLQYTPISSEYPIETLVFKKGGTN